MSLSRQALTLTHLKAAFAKVRGNGNAAGIDGITCEEFNNQAAAHLRALQAEVYSNGYTPLPLRRAWLKKPSKADRPLAIPAVRDRVLQTAVAQVLNPIFEAAFEDVSFAYRQGRSVKQAIEHIGVLQRQGYHWVLDADISKFFDSVDHEKLKKAFATLVPDNRLRHLLSLWLQTPIFENGEFLEPSQGIAQGSPISPLLSNLYLSQFDTAMLSADQALVRYADDFVVLTKTKPLAQDALELTEGLLADLSLGLNPLKTRILSLNQGLDYLGWHVVGQFALKKSRDPDTPDTVLHFTDLPNQGLDSQLLKKQHPKRKATGQNAAEAQALIQHYARAEPPPNSALADALSAVQLPERVHETSDILSTSQDTDDALPPARALQRTLYVVEHGCEVSKEGETFQVRKDGQLLLELPARAVDQILLFGNSQLTTAAIQLAMRNQIGVGLLSQLGRYYGRIESADTSALSLQRAQFKLTEDAYWPTEVARQFIRGKLGNSRVLLARYIRSHGLDNTHLLRIRDAMQRTKTVTTVESLIGLEGSASAEHFAVMRELLPGWGFERRQRQPPPDAINALLSLGYTLLYQCVGGLLQARGLNPHIGIMHTGSGSHLALASDLMEEFRAICVDALVLKLCLSGQWKPSTIGHIKARTQNSSTPGFQLDRNAVKAFIRAFEVRMNSPIKHPVTGEANSDMRRIIDGQVQQLIHTIRAPGEASYMPCIFK